ncbi:MAG: tryptophan/tyrosine permease, partial [Coxiellaceae bacterium]|nr:tryptophan/tyrosine permease [Coxiellaceae bacterium]
TGLIHIAQSGHATSELTTALSTQLGSAAISDSAHVFTSVCVTTSFLGVALCLSDFLTDGLRVRRRGWHRWLVMAVTFLPPLAVVLVYPNAFIMGLRYAGVFCVLLLLLIPAVMVWSGRYVKKIATGYRVWGGLPVLLLSIIVSVALLLYGLTHL